MPAARMSTRSVCAPLPTRAASRCRNEPPCAAPAPTCTAVPDQAVQRVHLLPHQAVDHVVGAGAGGCCACGVRAGAAALAGDRICAGAAAFAARSCQGGCRVQTGDGLGPLWQQRCCK